jgi:hypothetical protein
MIASQLLACGRPLLNGSGRIVIEPIRYAPALSTATQQKPSQPVRWQLDPILYDFSFEHAFALRLPSRACSRPASKKGVTLDLPDDVFLLHLALEATKGILQRLALLESNFCQSSPPHQ